MHSSTPSGNDFSGIANMTHMRWLPYLREGVKVHYEGSIDKRGGNFDYDWWLYQKNEHEWVILDVDGPGCLYNFAQHRYHKTSDVVFRFYFNGEKEPRYELKQSEFGYKPPFVAPLANMHAGWVKRFFLPIPFTRSCRVTSSEQLYGSKAEHAEGGWGHLIYHSYATADGMETFTGREDYTRLLAQWRNVGEDPKPTDGNVVHPCKTRIAAGATEPIFTSDTPGSIAALHLKVSSFKKRHLHDLWIRATWDGKSTPSVACPVGAFFANELGHHDIRLLSHGMSRRGTFYSYLPMPYWQSATLSIENRGEQEARLSGEVHVTPSAVYAYPSDGCGYFNCAYTPRTFSVPDRDFRVGKIRGRGHVVAGQITMYSHSSCGCEGDVRVHIDGIRTPVIESDGSESWASYGWGFWKPPQSEPSTGYDRKPKTQPVSMVKLCSGDWYPFYRELRFDIEHGVQNDNFMEHSGALFWYGVDTPALVLTDVLDIGNETSESAHAYALDRPKWRGKLTASYEGNDDDVLITDTGLSHAGYSEFRAHIRPDNKGVRLRRRSDQAFGRQRVWVIVDEVPVTERSWLYADRNPYKRWLDDEFEIPAAYTAGKSEIHIRLEFAPAGGATTWSEFMYWVYCYVDDPEAGVSLPDPSEQPDWHDINAEAAFDTVPWHTHQEGAVYYSKARRADTVYAFLTRAFLDEYDGKPLVLKEVATTKASRIDVICGTPKAAPSVRWSQGRGGLRLDLGNPAVYRDDTLLPKPVVLKITHAKKSR